MNQRKRVSIISLGVMIGLIFGLIFKDTYACLVTGIAVAAAITALLSQEARKAPHK